jgi:hypothetical protein
VFVVAAGTARVLHTEREKTTAELMSKFVGFKCGKFSGMSASEKGLCNGGVDGVVNQMRETDSSELSREGNELRSTLG